MTDHTWKMKLMLSKGDKVGLDMSGGISEGTKQALMDVFQRDEAKPKNPTLDQLEGMIAAWADVRGILSGRPEAQFIKLAEEVGEIAAALAKQRDPRDAIGDTFVVLCNLATLCDTSLHECATIAYNAIRDRKGHTSNGVFIREEEAMR